MYEVLKHKDLRHLLLLIRSLIRPFVNVSSTSTTLHLARVYFFSKNFICSALPLVLCFRAAFCFCFHQQPHTRNMCPQVQEGAHKKRAFFHSFSPRRAARRGFIPVVFVKSDSFRHGSVMHCFEGKNEWKFQFQTK